MGSLGGVRGEGGAITLQMEKTLKRSGLPGRGLSPARRAPTAATEPLRQTAVTQTPAVTVSASTVVHAPKGRRRALASPLGWGTGGVYIVLNLEKALCL